MTDVSRRALIKATGAIGAIGATMLPTALAIDAGSAQEHDHASPAPYDPPAAAVLPQQARGTTYLFLNNEEAAFVEAAVERLIPKDEQWAGRARGRCPKLHRQATGRRLGRRRAALSQRSLAAGDAKPGIPASLHAGGTVPNRAGRNQQGARRQNAVCEMGADQQDDYLKSLEAGGKDLGGVPSECCFRAPFGDARSRASSATRSTAATATWCHGG